jgi:glycosyltransferase involved in cell wall biosynthesis
MNNPYMSIIMPTFNCSGTIRAALDSIIMQTYESKEVVIIDGGSTDSTVDICKEYVAKYRFIVLISEKDQGVYDAMNKGIKIAKGEWIYFLGSDDYFYCPNVLFDLIGSIENFKEEFNMIYGNVSSPKLGAKYDGKFDRIKIIKKNICHQAIFYHRTVFEIVGDFNLKYKIEGDWEFNLRCFFNDKIKIKYIDLTIAYYSDGGLSSTASDVHLSKDFNFIVKRLGYKSLPLRTLKSFCNSNLEFFKLIQKRLFGNI